MPHLDRMPRSHVAAAAGAALLTLVLGVVTADAAGIVGDGSLDSCSEAALDAALVGGGTVTFDCGGPATIAISATKQLAVDTIVDGGGRVALSGADRIRVLQVEPDASVTLRALSIVDGYSGLDPGGAIRNLGTLSIEGCTIANSRTGGFGGGLANEGACTVTDTTFVANTAWVGGGLANFSTVTVRGSLFFYNVATYPGEGGNGGGIGNYGTLIAANTTFSRNEARSTGTGYVTGYGGGLDNEGVATVVNCTFTRNGAYDASCGGLHNNGLLTLQNSIVALSAGGADCCTSYMGKSVDSGSNLSDQPADCKGFTQVDPALLRVRGLADNGGPTLSVALETDSVAVDAGDPEGCAATAATGGIDQRGVPRLPPGDRACDIGAFELPFSAVPRPTPTPAMTFLDMQGDPTDFITFGRRYTYDTADARFRSEHFPGYVGIEIRGETRWDLHFSAIAGDELAVGDYDSAMRWPFQEPDVPGLDVGGDGRGCNRLTGQFSVREAVYAIDGTVENFAADFEQHCEGDAAVLRGSVRISSNLPTPTPRPCRGDCSGDGTVSVNEIVAGVGIGLGSVNLHSCPSFDGNSDGRVGIGELLASVSAALDGCGGF